MTDDPIAEGRAKAEAYNGIDGPGFHNTGAKNAYECETCHCYIITIDREPGVTPFITRCRVCNGEAISKMYRVAAHLEPTHEWIRPDSVDGLSPGTVDHIRNGGLILRAIPPLSDEWVRPEIGRVRRA